MRTFALAPDLASALRPPIPRCRVCGRTLVEFVSNTLTGVVSEIPRACACPKPRLVSRGGRTRQRKKNKGDVAAQKARWRRRQRVRRDDDPAFAERWRQNRREQKARAYRREKGYALAQHHFDTPEQRRIATVVSAGLTVTIATRQTPCSFCTEVVRPNQPIGKHPLAGWCHVKCLASVEWGDEQ